MGFLEKSMVVRICSCGSRIRKTHVTHTLAVRPWANQFPSLNRPSSSISGEGTTISLGQDWGKISVKGPCRVWCTLASQGCLMQEDINSLTDYSTFWG